MSILLHQHSTQNTFRQHTILVHTTRRQLANAAIDLAYVKRERDAYFLSPLDRRHVPLRPDCTRAQDLVTVPRFRLRLYGMRIRCGHDACLTVNVTAQPDCVVRWYKNDRQLTHQRRGAVHVYSCGSGVWELRILSAIPADAGVYACIATNCAGEARTTAVVTVEPADAERRRCDGPLWRCTCVRCTLTGCCGCDRSVPDCYGATADRRPALSAEVRDERLSAVRCRRFVGFNRATDDVMFDNVTMTQNNAVSMQPEVSNTSNVV